MADIKTLSKWQKRDCDRCGFTFYKHTLVRNHGLLVCQPCVDGPYQNSKVLWRFGGTKPAGIQPVYTISLPTGITRMAEFMMVQSNGGPITITGANITASTDKSHMILQGNSAVDTIDLVQDATLKLWEGLHFTLGINDIISLVYFQGVWTEISRSWYYEKT